MNKLKSLVGEEGLLTLYYQHKNMTKEITKQKIENIVQKYFVDIYLKFIVVLDL